MSEKFDEGKIAEYRAILASVTTHNLNALIFPESTPEHVEAIRREREERKGQERITKVINDAIGL